MPLKNWSVVAASNTSPPPYGSPEGWAMSDINNVMRQVMADVRTLAASGSIASASTTDLGSLDATFLTVTGVIGINSFGTVDAGIYKIITFDSALTITYNATSMILPGAVNKVTAAGDTALFVSLGAGNWKCVFYGASTGYAALAGNETQTFLAANSTSATQQVVPRAQADALYAALAGLATQTFLVSPATASDHAVNLGQFVQGLTGNGYQKLPSGLIVQWGSASVAASNANTDVTLPIAYPTSHLAAFISASGIASATQAGATNLSLTQIRLNQSYTGGAQQMAWLSIGY